MLALNIVITQIKLVVGPAPGLLSAIPDGMCS